MTSDPGFIDQWVCLGCGSPLEEVPTLGQRTPCPKCGSTRRSGSSLALTAIGVDQGTIVKGYNKDKRPNKPHRGRRPFYEELDVSDFNKDLGVKTWRHRIIDYVRNRYFELIQARETGKVVRDVDEPLSEHRNRGSARKENQFAGSREDKLG